MRLGILGPALGDLAALARAAEMLLEGAHAEKVLYLGDDDALDHVVATWARGLVGADPGDEALFARAASRCAGASWGDIDKFVASERARLRLKVFASLPAGPSRTIEILDGRVALFIYDKAMLDEEDIAAANVLVFGKGDAAIIRRVGARTFISPGPVASPAGGALLLDDDGGGVKIDVMTAAGELKSQEFIGGARGGKITVQGA